MLKAWQIVVTFNLVCLAWIFFRANSLSDGLYVITGMFAGVGTTKTFLSLQDTSQLVILIVSLVIICLARYKEFTIDKISALPAYLRWGIYYALVLSIISFASYGEEKFIYFKF